MDSLFDDYRRQPLLPNRFSQLGPGVSWIDTDGDGREDLVVGTGRGGSLAVLHNAPSRFTSAKSTDMQVLLVSRTASAGVRRKFPLPSLIQNWSGS